MSQNDIGQSYWRNFKSTISLEQKDEKVLSFCMLVQIRGNQNLFEKYFCGHGQKWVWPLCSHDSKIDCISRSNQLNKLIVGISDSNGIRTHNHLVGMLIRI